MAFKASLFGALMATGLFAGGAQATTFLTGTFEVAVANYDAGGDRGKAFASAANLAQNFDEFFTYTGALDFNVGSGSSATTTIADFLNSGSGTFSGLSAPLGAAILSTPTWRNTTVFGFRAFDLGGFVGNIRHDDGVRFFDNGVRELNAPAPTTAINSAFDFSGGTFQLLYAAANGNPSILEVTGTPAPIPLPAALPLLLAGLGGLGLMRRRKNKPA
ncbi:VPLPA-CTERM sorting domain-containing protein [Sulfitobacter sp. JB4-11]|uniref:VPLPA-CTERM sorting domain-containing protein n=1 Tax=Sulfitobacter rhodophyticola TaxID=3238304 RepID=UPI003D81C238